MVMGGASLRAEVGRRMTVERQGGYVERVEEGAEIRYSEVLSALSFVLDLVEGQPQGHVLRSCLIGMAVAERLGLDEERRSALFYALLMKDAGCSSNASRVAALFGADDFGPKRALKTVDWSRLPDSVLYVARSVSPDAEIWSKARRFFAVGVAGPKAARELVGIRCERGAEISRLMGFPEETARAIRNLDEHWDGAGHPDGLRREGIPLLARICGLAQTAEVFFTAYGPRRAEEVVRSRRGRWFDPTLVDALLAEACDHGLWETLREGDLTQAVAGLEPRDRVLALTDERLDLTALAFARVIDAKSPFTYRHSEGVAEKVVAMSRRVGLPEPAVRDQMRAGLLHDIGKLGVSNRILDKPGRLTDAEFAEMKKHPALTLEALNRVSPFRSIAEVAASHHERLDGSGYHRGLTGDDLNAQARMLAVADVFDAMLQDRPYRSGMPVEQALAIIRRESGTKLCPGSVRILEDLVSEGELP
jgi:HD-GYP domain-containing protein (c-di-GMP phosphodiesterase class II)